MCSHNKHECVWCAVSALPVRGTSERFKRSQGHKRGLPLSCVCPELALGQLPVLRMHKQPPLETAQVVLSRGLCCLLHALCFVER